MSEINPDVIERLGFVDFFSLWTDYEGDPNSLEILKAIETTQLEIAETFYEGDSSVAVDTSKLALEAVQRARNWAIHLTPEAFND